MKISILNYLKIFFMLCLFSLIYFICQADQDIEKYIGFKSLEHNNSNMRVGPGKRFEIKWNFKKIGLPVKVIKKYDNWYEILTPDGSKGWMHKRLLNNNKTIIFKKNSLIYSKPNIGSKLKANIDKNSVVTIKSCKKNWCKIEDENYDLVGYTLKENIWGAIASETN
tara:strand:- start:13527 stop:14027 length:501 start_codon:yes stop_codon:yes gene_type:complete